MLQFLFLSMTKITGKSKESLRFLIDLKEMKSKTYVATVLSFKVEAAIFLGGGEGGWGARKGHCLYCLFLLLCGSEVKSRLAHRQIKIYSKFLFNSHAHGKSRNVNFPVKSSLESSNLAHYPSVKNAKMTQESHPNLLDFALLLPQLSSMMLPIEVPCLHIRELARLIRNDVKT